MDEVFFGLSLIIAIAAIVSIVMRWLRQPLMIGYILSGIIVGPVLFNIVDSPDQLRTFGNIGIALLLFIIGLGMKPKVVSEVGRPSVITAVTHMTVNGTIGWFAGVALGLSHTEALFVAIALTINSTIVALKLLSDRKEMGRLYGKITVGISLVEDIIAACLLVMVAASQDGQWLAAGPLVTLLFKGALVAVAMYFVGQIVLPRLQRIIATDQEVLFLTAIAIGLGSAALLAKIGLSMEVGALAAGVLLASRSYAQEIAARLRPLRDFFIIVFFIALGTELTFSEFGDMFWLIVAAVGIVVVIKPIVIMATLGVLGYTKRTSFKTALALTQISEFSIIFIILASQKNLIGHNIVVLLTFIALASIAVSTYLVTFSDQLFTHFEKYLTLFERKKAHDQLLPETRYELVLLGYQRGGHEFINLFKKLKKKYIVIDYDPEVVDILDRRKINYIYGDATDTELLEEAGVQYAKLIVSTIPDFDVNQVLLDYIKRHNPGAVVILHGDDPVEAARYYQEGASYVVLPHYIGSEKVSEFIGKSGLAKSAFTKQRKRHLDYLEKHYGALEKLNEVHKKKLGHAIVSGMAALAKPKS